MQATFVEPVYLWLLLALPLVWLGAARLRSAGTARRWVIVAVRTLVVALLVLALAQLEIARRSERLTVYFVVDQSDSIPAAQRLEAQESIDQLLRSKRPDDEAGLVVFGATAAIEAFALRGFEYPPLINSVIQTTRTDIGRALRLAISAFPNATMRRVVLFSDGNENSGNALEAARLARNDGIPIDVVPLAYEHTGDVRIDKLVVPQETTRDAPFDVRVFLSSDQAASGRLRLFEDGVLIADEQVEVGAGRNPPLILRRRLDEPGFRRYEAVIEVPGDTRPQNNRAQAFTNLRGDPRILYVEGDPDRRNFFAAAMLAEGIRVDMVAPWEAPTALEELQSFDSIVLSNVHAGDLGANRQQMIETAVRDLGVGLVMIGGENAFGAGGYSNTPIERALPVSMDVRQKKVLPNGALVIILHTCEFANGNAWGREISKAALDVLSPQDWFGIAYYGAPPGSRGAAFGGWGDHWLWEGPNGDGLMQASQAPRMKAMIDGANPLDMKNFAPSFQMAYEALRNVQAQAKHIIVISDGDPSPPSKSFVEMMRDSGITISTVAIFPHEGLTVRTLEEVAYWGAGEFYYPKTAEELPRIFVKEATVVRRSLIFEETFTPVFDAPSVVLEGFGGLPPLDGYVVTSDKDLATVALRTHNDDPLLAHWRYGLGTTVAFTSDATNRWAAPWVDWEGYVKFWSQVVRFSLRQASSSSLQMQTELSGGRGRFTVDAIDPSGGFRNFMELEATVINPDMTTQQVRVRQVGPGRYEGDFEAGQIGSYIVRLNEPGEGGESVVSGISQSYSPEFETSRWNEDFLGRIASESGGRFVDDIASYNAFLRDLPISNRPTPLWPWLLLAGLLLVPVDVLVRRVYIDQLARELAARLRSRQAARALAAAEEESTQAQRAGALLAAKARAAVDKEKEREAEQREARKEFRRKLDEQEAQSGMREGSVFDAPDASAPAAAPRAKHTVTADEEGQGGGNGRAAGMSSLLEAKRRAREKRK